MMDSKYIVQYFPTLTVLCTIIVTSVVFYFLFLFQKRRRKQSSITQEFLRSPGQSLLEIIGQMNGHIQLLVCYLSVIPLIIYASLISSVYFGRRDLDVIEIISISVIAFVLMIRVSLMLVKKLNQRKKTRISYEGKLTTGQELNRLMTHGYYVYHDFPAENHTVDHILVGEKGVFAVETITCVQSDTDRKKHENTVEYNGHALHFPDFTDLETTSRVKDKAEWLSKWLSSLVNEPLAARAIVSVPGWYIKRTSADGISVVNPGQFDSLFEHIKSRDLDESTIKRLVEKLDHECRAIEKPYCFSPTT